MTPGWSFDLTMKDPSTGRPWDLSDEVTQRKVMRIIEESKQLFVVGSSMHAILDNAEHQ